MSGSSFPESDDKQKWYCIRCGEEHRCGVCPDELRSELIIVARLQNHPEHAEYLDTKGHPWCRTPPNDPNRSRDVDALEIFRLLNGDLLDEEMDQCDDWVAEWVAEFFLLLNGDLLTVPLQQQSGCDDS